MRTLLCLTLLACSAPAVAQRAAAPAAETDTDTREDVEIMRRLLSRAISDAVGSRLPGGVSVVRPHVGRLVPDQPLITGYVDFTGADWDFAGAGWGASVEHSRGYHVPGVGVLYSFDVRTPVVAEAVEPEGDAPPEPDAWEDMRRELHGDTSKADAARNFELFSGNVMGSVLMARSHRWVVDTGAVARVEDAVVDTLASHGLRVEALAPGESLVVAVTLLPGSSYPTFDEEGEVEALAMGEWFAIAGERRARTERLVVRLTRSDLEELDRRGAVNGDRRRAARVHRY